MQKACPSCSHAQPSENRLGEGTYPKRAAPGGNSVTRSSSPPPRKSSSRLKSWSTPAGSVARWRSGHRDEAVAGQVGKNLSDGIRHRPPHAERELVEGNGGAAGIVERDAFLQHWPLGGCREPMAYFEAGQLAGDRQRVTGHAERRSFEGFMDMGAGWGGAHGAIEIRRIGEVEAGGPIVKSDVDLSAVVPGRESIGVVGDFVGSRVRHAHRGWDRTLAAWWGPTRHRSVEVREYASLGGGPAQHSGLPGSPDESVRLGARCDIGKPSRHQLSIAVAARVGGKRRPGWSSLPAARP